MLAVDGCSVPIRFDIDDKITYFVNQKSAKRYNAYHLNASYDLMEHTYDEEHPKMKINKAFRKLVDRYNGIQAILSIIKVMNHTIILNMLYILAINTLLE